MDYGISPLMVSFHKHTKMIALFAAIIAVVVFVVILVILKKESANTAKPTGNSLIAAQALISAPNPPSGLSPEEIKARQALLTH